jgi:hypothetical protein
MRAERKLRQAEASMQEASHATTVCAKGAAHDNAINSAAVDALQAVTVAHRVGSSRRDLALAHGAFYSGARGVLKVLDHMLEHGDIDELHRTIQRQGRYMASR